jgi:transcriptional regulator with XRE-family HTH domain
MEEDVEVRMRIELGRRIVTLRERLGLSRVALAKRVGVDRSRLGKWERGQHQPLIHHLVKLADVLSVPIDALFRGEIPPRSSEPILATSVRHTIADAVSTLSRLLEAKPGRRHPPSAPPNGGVR